MTEEKKEKKNSKFWLGAVVGAAVFAAIWKRKDIASFGKGVFEKFKARKTTTTTACGCNNNNGQQRNNNFNNKH